MYLRVSEEYYYNHSRPCGAQLHTGDQGSSLLNQHATPPVGEQCSPTDHEVRKRGPYHPRQIIPPSFLLPSFLRR